MEILIRKGRGKAILDSAIESALLAVEVYNKPRTTFRCEAYITLMIIAWTKLFHSYFYQTIGDKFYYKKKNGRYAVIDGEKSAWDLSRCIKEYGKLSEPSGKNLQFFIKIRNKIEHRHVDKHDIDVKIFGECQSLLYNFENTLIDMFGEKYSINESLVFSLQFSHVKTKRQKQSNKSALAKDAKDIFEYIKKYREDLAEEVYNSQEYSIKALIIPKITNTNRHDFAIEFVRLENGDEDKGIYDNLYALVKDKKIIVEGVNIGKLKPSMVVDKINEKLGRVALHLHSHFWIAIVFSVRPKGNADDPFDTNTSYCHYDEVHRDYLYNEEWVDFIYNLFSANIISIDDIKIIFDSGNNLNIEEYAVN